MITLSKTDRGAIKSNINCVDGYVRSYYKGVNGSDYTSAGVHVHDTVRNLSKSHRIVRSASRREDIESIMMNIGMKGNRADRQRIARSIAK